MNARKTGTLAIPPKVIATKENKKIVAEIEKKVAADVKKISDNGCISTYKAYAVLMKKDVDGGLYVMRTLTIKDGKIVSQQDTVEDLAGVQMGKAMFGLEEVMR